MRTCHPCVIVSHFILQKHVHCSTALTAPHFLQDLLSNCNISEMSSCCWLLGVGWCRLPTITGTPFSFRVNGKESKLNRFRLRVPLISVSDYYFGATLQVLTHLSVRSDSCLISCSCSCFVVAMKPSIQQMYSSQTSNTDMLMNYC